LVAGCALQVKPDPEPEQNPVHTAAPRPDLLGEFLRERGLLGGRELTAVKPGPGLRLRRYGQPSAQLVQEVEQSLRFKDAFRVGFSDLNQLKRFLSSDMTRNGVGSDKAELWAKSLLHSAQAHDLNPLVFYAVVRHESGDFRPRLQAEAAGNYLFPARRDLTGRVVDAGVFGVAQVKYDAHRQAVPWAELSLQRITGTPANLLGAASSGDNGTVSAISLLIGAKVLKTAISSAALEIDRRRVRGTSPAVAALQIYNRGTLKNHDAGVRYAKRVLSRWQNVSQEAKRFVGSAAKDDEAPMRLAANARDR
jgi:hypothetical protein